MRSKILHLLTHQDVVSGEYLSQQLNVSRVTIWKHINKLKDAGYLIESTSKGYHLDHSPDAPFEWEFPDRKGLIHYYEEIESTMGTAKELARKGCPAYTVVIAGKQSNGRGRLQRKWVSDSGGLYFTLVLRPDVPPSLMSQVSFAASLCLSRAIEKETGILAKVKWPNDLHIGPKKLCGMLCEMDVTDERVEFLNIGIGINVNNTPENQEPNATSLKAVAGKQVSRKRLLSAFLSEIEHELSKPSLDHIISDWKTRAISLDRRVKVVTTQNTVEGKAIDVDDSGALIVETQTGESHRIYFGDCFLQPE